jgi:hypothetical protein
MFGIVYAVKNGSGHRVVAREKEPCITKTAPIQNNVLNPNFQNELSRAENEAILLLEQRRQTVRPKTMYPNKRTFFAT